MGGIGPFGEACQDVLKHGVSPRHAIVIGGAEKLRYFLRQYSAYARLLCEPGYKTLSVVRRACFLDLAEALHELSSDSFGCFPLGIDLFRHGTACPVLKRLGRSCQFYSLG